MRQPGNRCTVNNLGSANTLEPGRCPVKDASVDLCCITLKIHEPSAWLRSRRAVYDAIPMRSRRIRQRYLLTTILLWSSGVVRLQRMMFQMWARPTEFQIHNILNERMHVKILTNLILLSEKLEFLFDNRSSSASASKTILTGCFPIRYTLL